MRYTGFRLTVDLAEREPVDDHPEVVEERQGDDHVPVVAELTGRVEDERPPYALDAVRRPVAVLPGTAVLLPAAVEADGTARVVVRRPTGRATAAAAAAAARLAATAGADADRRRRHAGTAAAVAHVVGTVKVYAAGPVLNGRRFAATRLGGEVRVRAGNATRQTAAGPVRVRRRQRIPGV